jgi:hypothetical protein
MRERGNSFKGSELEGGGVSDERQPFVNGHVSFEATPSSSCPTIREYSCLVTSSPPDL